MPLALPLPGRLLADLPLVRSGRRLPATLLCLALALLAGCAPYKFAGDRVFRLSEQKVVPLALTGEDMGVNCAAAMTFTGPALAFEKVGTDVDRLGALLWMGGGVCAEREAIEQELRFLRAMYQQQPVAAQDARIAQKRLLAAAARREYQVWQRFLKIYGDRAPGDCPKFVGETDELVYMIGLLAGVQATVNAVQAGQFMNISRDIAPKAVKLSVCVDNEKWWHLPEAMRAALWQAVPMFAPENLEEEPLVTLQRVATLGKQDGLRMGYAVWALVAVNGGDDSLARTVLRDFATVEPGWQRNPRYRILDVIAEEMVTALSDRMWTEATGHRTPFGGLGTFWDDAQVQPNIDDLL